MANVTPPKYVRQILFSLQSRGFAAYLVGGCVRDILLGVRPQDWDICTAALPEQVLDVFPGSRPTGIKHGTVTVVIGSRSAEVTTFRSEGDYTDHRHPSSVAFVGDLTTDLMRRDFTMNAMAVSADGLIIDPYGGAEDIRRGCIRCVGAPEKRFDEDALRMLRAFRFSSRLGFEIEPATLAAIGKKAPLAAGLAAERVSAEVEKILLTARPETLNTVISLGLIDKYLDRRAAPEEEQLHRIAALPKKSLERWAALCRLLTVSGAIRSAEQFLPALRLDSRSIRCCNDACEMLESPAPGSPHEWKKLLRQYGVDSVSCAARCHDALCGGSSCRALKAVIKSGECFSMKQLAVDGDDLAALGLRGRELGEMLSFLLGYVMEYPDNNRRELLLSLASASEEYLMDSWENLKRDCAACRGCSLCETRRNLVFGVGNEQAQIMLIGEGPGEQEDKQGIPFVGPAGHLLDDMLQMIDLDRSKVYIANIVKCRPPGNRDPLGIEQDACWQWLERQIALVQPRIIVCLGRIAAMKIIKEDFRITREHGQWFDIDQRRVMATFHPSALLRDQSKRPDAFMDLRALRKEIKAVCDGVY